MVRTKPTIITGRVTGNPLKHLRVSDIRGIAQLATQATAGVTRIVEGVHQAVLGTVGFRSIAHGHTGGFTRLVYTSIHAVTRLLGKGVDTVLATLQRQLELDEEATPGSHERETMLAILNGVLGDHLLASNNPLTTRMSLRYLSKALNWPALPEITEATGKVLLLVHGLCMNDLQWQAQDKGRVVSHGETLALALAYSPIYVRYNSGLHISLNGRELSAHLEQLIAHWPVPIEELTVVAHSMGGLLIRSALYYARQQNLLWPDYLKSIVFLGTPHHGAPLERAGNWIDALLDTTPFTAPFARLGKLRSAGITDLRYGFLLDEDWQGRDRFKRQTDTRKQVPLPEGVACYTIAATTAGRRGIMADRLVGDGLVPLLSALGQHHDAPRSLGFAKNSQRIYFHMKHIELLSSQEVSLQLLKWLK